MSIPVPTPAFDNTRKKRLFDVHIRKLKDIKKNNF